MAEQWRGGRKDGRKHSQYVTHDELRAILEPIFERHRLATAAWEFYDAMTKLGLKELLPEILDDERTRQVLRRVQRSNWQRWSRVAMAVGILYGLLTTIGSSIAILRTIHVVP